MYPFGQLLPGRHGNSKEYRYGFQGQEKDDELKGEGNSLNYTFRMHDPRVGRFFATDPLEAKYSYLTPYQFSSNQPIHACELEGLESSNELGPKTITFSNQISSSETNSDNSLYDSFENIKYAGPSLNTNLGYTTRIDHAYLNPQNNGFKITNPFAKTTLVQHALGLFRDPITGKITGTTNSPFISTSEKFFGAETFKGKGNRFWIDMDIIAKEKVGYISNKELSTAIKNSLDEYPFANKWLNNDVKLNREGLFTGDVPSSAVNSSGMMLLRGLGTGLKIYGAVMTARDIGNAVDKSIATKSYKPALAETVRQAGSWGGSAAGAVYIGGWATAAFAWTGPGALAAGFIGGVVGGIIGYYGADMLADEIDKN